MNDLWKEEWLKLKKKKKLVLSYWYRISARYEIAGEAASRNGRRRIYLYVVNFRTYGKQ